MRVAKLVALDARDMHLIAEASIDVPLPLGFHGSFQRATAINGPAGGHAGSDSSRPCERCGILARP